MKKLFVSLFSGAGGLDQGFISAGWEPALMADNWEPAVDTLGVNHPSIQVHLWDLSTIKTHIIDDALNYKKFNIACVIGGAPCQAYSRLNQLQLFQNGVATEENLNDPRRSLFMDFLRIVRYIHPPFFVMENVPDLKTRMLGGSGTDKDRLIIDVITEEINKAGYNVIYDVLRATDYNVPQMRKRMIFLGVRRDLRISPTLPLPVPLSISVTSELAKIQPRHPNQKRKIHPLEWVEKVSHVPQGGYYNDLPCKYKVLKPVVGPSIQHSDVGMELVNGYCLLTPDGEYHVGQVTENLLENAKYFKIMPRMGTYLRRIRETVSHTVTRNPLIHPTENRELTVREKAAIQTFPMDYEFSGNTSEQHILVGNAVPCNMGKAIAEHMIQWLR